MSQEPITNLRINLITIPENNATSSHHQVPSVDTMLSIAKLSDLYYMDEIHDYVDDGILNWNQIHQKLFPNVLCDSVCTGNPHTDCCKKWTKYKSNIRRYTERHISLQNQLNKPKRISLAIPITPLIMLGYESPSKTQQSTSSSRASFAHRPSLQYPTPISAPLDGVNDKTLNPVIHAVFSPIGLLQAETSDANHSDVEILSPDRDDIYDIYLPPSLDRDDSDHFKRNQMKIESENEQCCSKKPIYRCSYFSGIYGSYTVGYSHSIYTEQKQSEDCFEHCFMDKLNQLLTFCEPLKRIKAFLNKYYDNAENMCNDEYGIQQLNDDFMHIKRFHIDSDNDKMRNSSNFDVESPEISINIAHDICTCFQKEISCNIEECDMLSRHHDDKDQILSDDICIEDRIFQSECDKVHVYFMHSLVQYCGMDQMDQDIIDEYRRCIANRMSSKRFLLPYIEGNVSDDMDSKTEILESETKEQYTEHNTAIKTNHHYLGAKEDNLWWKDVKVKGKIQSNDTVHGILVEKMGVFRWQNPHGFMMGQDQEIGHYKQRHINIKQEVLHNNYEPLAIDSWNTTLRKAKIFFNSFLRQKIRTQHKGFYEDQITQHSQAWDAGTDIDLKEIMSLKLYTDFDKLQFALKKCFRFETFDDILRRSDNANNHAKARLKDRLESFYHWRGSLLITLNKFGTKLSGDNNKALYHGVNAKMIIKASQTFAFSGPLSTTSSFHVARTFATAKGMVLTLATQFPRLNYCNAFDVSLISEYPEEQEWLVGSLYARLLKVSARALTKTDAHSLMGLREQVPLSSWARQMFFVIHLFDEQILSMTEDLEKMLAAFLRVNMKECCGHNMKYNQYKRNMDYLCSALCNIAHKCGDKDDEMRTVDEDEWKQKRILEISWNKFEEFRKKPNYKQHIRFDSMSDGLKWFFMEPRDEINIKTNKRYWSVSFDKIIMVYPGIEEMCFMNEYKLDDRVLSNLIKCDKNNQIRKISFLYHNYKSDNKPLNHRTFQDPDSLDKELMAQLSNIGWKMKHKKNGETGYKIRMYR